MIEQHRIYGPKKSWEANKYSFESLDTLLKKITRMRNFDTAYLDILKHNYVKYLYPKNHCV